MELEMAKNVRERIRMDINPSEELRRAIDLWRIDQPGGPSRAVAGRMLIEEILAAKGVFKPTQAKRKTKQ